MTETPKLTDQQQLQLLNQEAGKISWHELERFFAAGQLRYVSAKLDLLKVALALKQDRTDQVSSWLNNGSLSEVTDDQARKWHEDQQDFWSIVLRPYVLIQEIIKE